MFYNLREPRALTSEAGSLINHRGIISSPNYKYIRLNTSRKNQHQIKIQKYHTRELFESFEVQLLIKEMWF